MRHNTRVHRGAPDVTHQPRDRGPHRRLRTGWSERVAGRQRPARVRRGAGHPRSEWRGQVHPASRPSSAWCPSWPAGWWCSGATRWPPVPDVAYVPQADTLDPEFPVSAEHVVLMGRYRRIGWVRRPGRADRAAAAGGAGSRRSRRGGPPALRHAVGRPAPTGAAGTGHRPGGPPAPARRAVQRRRRRQPAITAGRPRPSCAPVARQSCCRPTTSPSPTSRAATPAC